MPAGPLQSRPRAGAGGAVSPAEGSNGYGSPSSMRCMVSSSSPK
jgi:hypothetical protein